MPMTVPIGPAIGRKVVPGMTKAPHPTLHPKASAHAPRVDKYGKGPRFAASLVDLFMVIRSFSKEFPYDCSSV